MAHGPSRLVLVLLALVYALGGTGLIAGLLDRVAPLAVASADGASHACCCDAGACQCDTCATHHPEKAADGRVALVRCGGPGKPATAPASGPDHQSRPASTASLPTAPAPGLARPSSALDVPSALLDRASKIPI